MRRRSRARSGFLYYQWHVDNVPLAVPKQMPPCGLNSLNSGQSVFVEIIPTDAVHKGNPYRTKSVVVGNTSPRVATVSLTPQIARRGQA